LNSLSSRAYGKTKFYLCAAITLLLILADGALTYIGTPDLSMEGNPLVSVLGLGWKALFIANSIGFALYVSGVYYAFVRYKSPVIQCNGLKQYSSMLFFNRPDKFIWNFYRMPKNWAPTFAVCGYALMCVWVLL